MARNLRACVNGHGLTGKAAAEAEALLKQYEDILGQERLAFLGDEGAAEAAARLKQAEIIRSARARERLRRLLQAVRLFEAEQAARAHPRGMGDGIQALLGHDIHHKLNNVTNVETLRETIRQEGFRIMGDYVERFRTRGTGVRGRAAEDEDQLLDALFDWLAGRKSGTEFDEIVEGWGLAIRYLTAEFRRAGGHLPERAGYFPNPRHDPHRVAFAADTVAGKRRSRFLPGRQRGGRDREAWIGFVRPLLDREKMVDFRTGETLNDLQLDALLSEVWETLASDGLNKIRPGQFAGGTVATGRADPRILHWKDAESWRAYNERFGSADIVVALVDHVEGLSRDIALMRVLGPDPDRTVRTLVDMAEKDGLGGIKRRHIEHQYRILSGQVGTGSPLLAAISANLRHLFLSNQLGSAAVVALGDQGFLRLTAEFNGLDANRAQAWFFRMMASGEVQTNLTRQGLIVSDLLGATAASGRFADLMDTGRAGAKLSDFVLRASLLVQMTENGQRAFMLSLRGEMWDRLRAHGTIAEMRGTDRAFNDMLVRYGVSEEDWALMRRAEATEMMGSTFFDPARLMELDGVPVTRLQETAERIRAIELQEANFATPTSNSRVDALLGGGFDRGTIPGEMLRFLTLYKRFPVLIVHTHMMRALTASADAPGGRWWYGARLALYTTVMGGLAVSIREAAVGRDPMALMTNNPGEFLARAAWTGGALGIWGDVLLTDTTGFGRSVLQTLVGPGWDFVNDTWKLGPENLMKVIQAATGTRKRADITFGRDLVHYFNRYLTPGSNIWYLRLAWDRYVVDQLHELADPEYARRRRERMVRRMREERGQEYFFAPGALVPGG